MHALGHRDGPYLSGTWLWSDESKGIVAWSVNSLKEVFAEHALLWKAPGHAESSCLASCHPDHP